MPGILGVVTLDYNFVTISEDQPNSSCVVAFNDLTFWIGQC